MIRRTLLAVSLSALAFASSAMAADRPLRIGYVFAMANAPALIADKQGFYREEGLDVDLKALGDGPVIQQALAAGELDVAYVGTPPVYQWYSRGLKSTILAKVNYGQAAVLVGQDSPITQLQQLKGNPPGTARHEAEPLGPLQRHQGLEGQGFFLLLGK